MLYDVNIHRMISEAEWSARPDVLAPALWDLGRTDDHFAALALPTLMHSLSNDEIFPQSKIFRRMLRSIDNDLSNFSGRVEPDLERRGAWGHRAIQIHGPKSIADIAVWGLGRLSLNPRISCEAIDTFRSRKLFRDDEHLLSLLSLRRLNLAASSSVLAGGDSERLAFAGSDAT